MQKHKLAILNFIFIVILIIIVFFVSEIIGGNDSIKALIISYGYPGLFLIAVISGFNLLVPIPAIAFLPIVVSAGLNFWIAIIIITIGMTIGDGVGFMLGRTGRRIIKHENLPKFVQKIERYLEENPKMLPIIVLLYATFAPMPNEVLIIPISFINRPWWHILGPVLAGNAIFNILVAFGFLSITGLI
jgi:membrane protein YqaA with SNARE-associated domain